MSSFVPKSLPRSSKSLHGTFDLTPSKVPPVPKFMPNNLESPASGVTSKQNIFGTHAHGHIIGSQKSKKPTFHAHTIAPKSSRQRIPLDDIFVPQAPDITSRESSRFSSRGLGLSSKVGTRAKEATRETANEKMQISNTLYDSNEVVPASADSSVKKSNSPKSSAAFRETIAKAKQAHRIAVKLGDPKNLVTKKNVPSSIRGNEDINGLLSDANLLRKRVNMARTSGRLNLAALGLHELPACIKDMYNIENIDINSGEWYESVDLVRLLAADNELTSLPSWAFPDFSFQSTTDQEEGHNDNIFGGLQSIDLHGNNLSELPYGLQRLTRLTSIDLSRNRLTNTCINVLSQISSLQELRLARNSLTGALDASVSNLIDLEVLDLQENSITDLGLALKDVIKLRYLDISGNRLVTIPSYILESLSLTDINAARNQLTGALIPEDIKDLAALRNLNVSYNSLTAITHSETLSLLSLQDLNVADNRLCAIPNMSGWTNLITLCAGRNQLTSIPDGLTSLSKLKTLDISCNDIRQLDYRLGLMDSLTSVEVANNPLRERRYLGMKTDDLKQELRDRIPPQAELDNDSSREDGTQECVSINEQRTSIPETTWPMKPGGVLDLHSTNLHDLDTSHLERILQTSEIHSIILHHNHLPTIPTNLSLCKNTLTTLDLSHNALTIDSYPSFPPLSLPHLKSLDLSSNTITTLRPLTTSLHAPLLSTLNISYNRLPSLSPLQISSTSTTTTSHFPSLTTLLASNNSLSSLDVDVVRGLHVLDVSENSIERLDPRLGLLAKDGLRTLLVGGNRFRVPRREVTERGTEVLLEWLRGRIPVGLGPEGMGMGMEMGERGREDGD